SIPLQKTTFFAVTQQITHLIFTYISTEDAKKDFFTGLLRVLFKSRAFSCISRRLKALDQQWRGSRTAVEFHTQ
ncbi:MAG: hypothetical protein ACYYK0_07955, partial [Candidatus Eutrophobiaceae bacterium]